MAIYEFEGGVDAPKERHAGERTRHAAREGVEPPGKVFGGEEDLEAAEEFGDDDEPKY